MPLMLRRFAKWTLGAAAALVLLAVAMNAFDEDVHPEVKAYLEARPPAVPDERNGYFHVVGLAVEGAEPHAAGRLYTAALAEAQEKRLAGQKVQWPELEERLPVLLKSDVCAMESGAPCLERVRADPGSARKLLAEHALLLDRYRALLEYPDYLETQRLLHYETPLPAYLPLVTGQRLFHVQAALRLQDGKAIQVAYDLERSVKLSRRMLAGSATLLGKMVAVAHARRAALFLSQMLPALARADRKALGAVARTLAPLAPAERSLVPVYVAELALLASALRSCESGEDALSCYFLQPNATLNRHYLTFHKPLLAADAAPAHRFDELRGAAVAPSLPWWGLLYNPMGKWWLAASAGPPAWDYVARTNDLEALFRLVSLQALIGERGLHASEVPDFLAGNVKRYGDPYSAKAMGWDAARRQLYFEPRGTPGLRSVGGVEKRFSAGLI
jgi:hypothetical protein